MQALFLHSQRLLNLQPIIYRFLAENRRTLIVSGTTLVLMIVIVVFIAARQALACAPEQSRLVYPLYDRKGIVADWRMLCGIPHRGCTQRPGDPSVYDCSPFMAPKGSLTRR